MAFCIKCGEEIDDEAVICPKCGFEIKKIGENKKGFDISKILNIQMSKKTGILIIVGIVAFFTIVAIVNNVNNKKKRDYEYNLSQYNYYVEAYDNLKPKVEDCKKAYNYADSLKSYQVSTLSIYCSNLGLECYKDVYYASDIKAAKSCILQEEMKYLKLQEEYNEKAFEYKNKMISNK